MILSLAICASLLGATQPVEHFPELPRWLSPQDVLMALAAEQPRLLGLGPQEQLVDVRVLEVTRGVVVRARRAYRGVPVLDQDLALRLNEQGAPVLLLSDFAPVGALEPVLVGEAEAVQAAVSAVYRRDLSGARGDAPVPVLLGVSAPHHAFVYQVVVPGPAPWQVYRVLVHGRSGAVLEARSLAQHAANDAAVYDPSPAPGPALPAPQAVSLDRLNTPGPGDPWVPEGSYARAFSCRSGGDELRVRTCNDVLGFLCALAPAEVQDMVIAFCGQAHNASSTDEALGLAFAPDDDLVFPYPSSSQLADPFAEVNAYYHLDAAVAFAATLGVAVPAQPAFIMTNVILPSPGLIQCASAGYGAGQAARTAVKGCLGSHGFLPMDNAFYLHDDPSDSFDLASMGALPGGIYMGQGLAGDYAYDATVIYHEYGHAVAAQVGAFRGSVLTDAWGLDDSPAALNEGFADYFSAAKTGATELGTYVGGRAPGSAGALRSIDHQLACPDYWTGEPHDDSQGFGGALWEARALYPQEDTSGAPRRWFDVAVMDAVKTITAKASHAAAYAALVAAVSAIPELEDEQGAVVAAVLEARSLDQCHRARPISPSATVPEMSFAGAGAGDSPLASIVDMVSYTPYAPPPLQFVLDAAELSPSECATFHATLAPAALSFDNAPDVFGGGGGAPKWSFQLLQRHGSPVAFSYGSNSAGVTVSAGSVDATVPVAVSGAELRASLTLPGSGLVYLALVNATDEGGRLVDIGLSAVDCEDTGSNENGGSLGGPSDPDAAPSSRRSRRRSGCNGPGSGPLVLLMLLGLVRRQRG